MRLWSASVSGEIAGERGGVGGFLGLSLVRVLSLAPVNAGSFVDPLGLGSEFVLGQGGPVGKVEVLAVLSEGTAEALEEELEAEVDVRAIARDRDGCEGQGRSLNRTDEEASHVDCFRGGLLTWSGGDRSRLEWCSFVLLSVPCWVFGWRRRCPSSQKRGCSRREE
jgi:hypothetical protein